jgi:hypothetical protein
LYENLIISISHPDLYNSIYFPKINIQTQFIAELDKSDFLGNNNIQLTERLKFGDRELNYVIWKPIIFYLFFHLFLALLMTL